MRIRIQAVVVLMVAALGLLQLPSPALATDERARSTNGAQEEFYYRYFNYHTGNCILSRGDGNGSPVVQWEGCKSANYSDQRWTFRLASSGDQGTYYYMVNQNSQKCLLARTSDHLAVQWDCMAYADQMWAVRHDKEGEYFRLINKESGRCLVVGNIGHQAFTHPCDFPYDDQWWDWRG